MSSRKSIILIVLIFMVAMVVYPATAAGGTADHEVIFEVVDEDGISLEGATVEIGGSTETTDVNGEAVFVLQEGTYDYTVSKENCETAFGTLQVDGDMTKQVTLLTEYILTVNVQGQGTTQPAEGTHSYPVAGQYYYWEDFEGDSGSYTTSGPDWEWGDPVTWPGNVASGDNGWGTNLDGNYSNNATNVLTSPAIDLSDVPAGAQLEVSWWQAYHVEASSWDQAYAEVKIGDGAWTQMWKHEGSTTRHDWQKQSYDLSGAAGETVQFRWRLVSDNFAEYPGYYVDYVTILSGDPPASETLTATPDTGWEFDSWTGDVADPDSSETTIVMDDNKTATAIFVSKQYTIAADVAPEGTGTAAGGGTYSHGDTVTVTAIPSEGYEFVNWTESGAQVSTDAEYTFQAAENRNLVANFQVGEYTVAFEDYDGTLLKEETVQYGSDATAPADPTREGYNFTGWDADFTGVTGDLTVNAQYEAVEYVLTMQKPQGEGEVVPGLGLHNIDYGTVVDLVAQPANGWKFARWTGDVEDTRAAQTTITVEMDETVQAVFEPRIVKHTVTIEQRGEGSIDPVPDKYRHNKGTHLIVKAVPDAPGFLFDHWEVDGEEVEAEGAAATMKITVESDVTVVGVFAERPVVKPYTGRAIDPRKGGHLDVEGFVSMEVAPGATENPVEWGVTVRDERDKEADRRLGAKVAFCGVVYEFSVTELEEFGGEGIEEFAEPITMTFPLEQCGEVEDPSDLVVSRYDERQGIWIPMPTRWEEEKEHLVVTTRRLSLVAIFEGTEKLVDVKEHWAEEHILEMTAVGAVDGYPDLTFKPDGAVTREQFAKMAVEAAGISVSSEPFRLPYFVEDADEVADWAKPYVEAAFLARLVRGYEDGTFRPKEPVTRAQMATVISRMLKLRDQGSPQFDDADQIPAWAKGHVAALSEQGLLRGYSQDDVKFMPYREATRAEAATLLSRYLNVRLDGQ